MAGEFIANDYNKLKELYSVNSKHSNYQQLSSRLKSIIGDQDIIINTRHEKERLDYIIDKVDVTDKTVLDIGGNSGYFTFELIDNGAQKVHYYEGNPIHSEFVRQAAEVLSVKDSIEITNDYFVFNEEYERKYDIVLCLNVLHHIGDDFGTKEITLEKAKQNIALQLKSLARISNILIFQLGFNWKGNRELGLFQNGTKKEMIDFVKTVTDNYFDFMKIGIAEMKDNVIKYEDLNDYNIERNDKLGEFLNRPIFILKSII
jgi:SAM-dependent methyltransferase